MNEQQVDRDQPMTDHDRMNYWWRRAAQAEARIKAVQDALDGYGKPTDRIGGLPDAIRRALDGE